MILCTFVEERSHEEQLRLSKLAQQNEALRRQHKKLERQLREKVCFPLVTLGIWSDGLI